MSISDNGVIFKNGAESSLVVEVKEKQESDSIFLELKGCSQQSRLGGSSGRDRYTFAQ